MEQPRNHESTKTSIALRVFVFSLLIAAASISSGCLVIALQPAYDDESLVFDEGLIGQWENAEDRTSATIEGAEWRSYKISYTDHSTTTPLHANLTRIGAALFLDVTQARGTDTGPYLLPLHGVYRVQRTADTLTASALDYGWFTRELALKKLNTLTVGVDGRRNVVIAGSSSEIRAWLG